MFYDALKKQCPLEIDPFKALVGPRPIGWISTVSATGVANLAPYSFFNAVADEPPLVMFSSGGHKDTLLNIAETGEFVCNLATHQLKDAMNKTAKIVEPTVDEFELAGLEKVAGTMVSVPRVASSPVALECRQTANFPLKDVDGNPTKYEMVVGQVVGVYIDDAMITDGRVDTRSLQQLARHGYMDYSTVFDTYRIERPS